MVRGLPFALAVNPTGVITGFGFCAASATDQQVAETFFAIRHRPNSRLPSVGSAAWGPYVADKGFEGEENHRRWLEYARSSRRSTTSSSMPSASGGSGPMSWKACELAWRRG